MCQTHFVLTYSRIDSLRPPTPTPQELHALLRRTAGADPSCLTLVATTRHSSNGGSSGETSAGDAVVAACLDVRLLDAADAAVFGGWWPDGVPRCCCSPPPGDREPRLLQQQQMPGCDTQQAQQQAAYISNVVVAAPQRGQGLGARLVAAAVAQAARQWRVGCVYCHVEVDNAVRGRGGGLDRAEPFAAAAARPASPAPPPW